MKILLVEDDNQIAEALAEALTKQHYAVDTAADVQAGWEMVEVFTYDLLLLDVAIAATRHYELECLQTIVVPRSITKSGNTVVIFD